MSEDETAKKQAAGEADGGEPSIGEVSELHEREPGSGKLVTRRELARAAAALGIAAEAEEAMAASRGAISYVLCHKAFNSPVKQVAFSPGGGRLGALSDGGQLLVWDTQTLAKPLAKLSLSGLQGFAWGFRETLLAWDAQGTFRCYDESGRRVFESTGAGIRLAGFSSSGNWLVLLDARNGLRIWDAEKWQTLKVLDAGALASSALTAVGATREGSQRVYLVAEKTVILVDPSSGTITRFPEGGQAEGEKVFVSASSEKVGLVTGRRLRALTFPGGHPWGSEVDLGEPGQVETFSPGLDYLLGAGADDRITLRPIGTGEAVQSAASDVKGVTCLACSFDPGTYAWGGRDGRVVVHRSKGATLSAENFAPAYDPALGKIGEFAPKKVRLPYRDCTCTCDSVEVTKETNSRMTQVWDSVRQSWENRTLPCGSPIPAGAICVCNCVSAGASPIWSTVCTCDTICTCNTQGGGGYLEYWY
jgi:hypothetical protein